MDSHLRLSIAEKPSVAKVIAGEWSATNKGDGYIKCGPDKVTCASGTCSSRPTRTSTSEEVPRGLSGKKVWRVDQLPIIPQSWIRNPDLKGRPKISKGRGGPTSETREGVPP